MGDLCPSAPVCSPTLVRAENLQRWASRSPMEADPAARLPLGVAYQTIATFEVRASDVACMTNIRPDTIPSLTWEVSVFEESATVVTRDATISVEDAFNLADPLLELPSGILRLGIKPQGSNQTWSHDGHGTAIVTAPSITVEVRIPAAPFAVAGNEAILDTTSGGDDVRLRVSKPTIKIIGTPVTSRRPTWLRHVDIGNSGAAQAGGINLPLVPGAIDVWVDATTDPVGAELCDVDQNDARGNTILIPDDTIVPASGFTHIFIPGTLQLVRVVQRTAI